MEGSAEHFEVAFADKLWSMATFLKNCWEDDIVLLTRVILRLYPDIILGVLKM